MQAPNLELPGGTESTCIVASPVLRQGQPNGGEGCIVLESGPTRTLVAKLPQCLLLEVCEFRAASEEHCKRGYGWVGAKLCYRMLRRPKRIRMITAMYVSSADLLSVHYAKIMNGARLHRGPQNCPNWEWALAQGWVLARDNTAYRGPEVKSHVHY